MYILRNGQTDIQQFIACAYLELDIVFCCAIHLRHSIFQVFLQVIAALLQHLICICQILSKENNKSEHNAALGTPSCTLDLPQLTLILR